MRLHHAPVLWDRNLTESTLEKPDLLSPCIFLPSYRVFLHLTAAVARRIQRGFPLHSSAPLDDTIAAVGAGS
jgi:hypothetical protein